ncbi:MAG TPA: DUF4136 domain-containing protein [Thiopseudomonas sp.]|nr:DUF4136 domain-containing protein [Thiopseudomonas sp.]
MYRYLYAMALPVLLLGCQTNNPYQTESLPLAQITHTSKHLPANSKASKTPYDYRYWCWATHPQTLTVEQQPESAQAILAEQLEQYGLRPAETLEQCELQVQLSTQHSSHRVVYDHYPSAYYGYGYGHPFHDRYRYSGFAMHMPIYPRSSIHYSLQLQLSFTDAASDRLIWRNVNAVNSDQYGQATEQALRKAFTRMLNSFF